MARIVASRFALLNVDDENDSDETQKQGKTSQGKGGQQAGTSKKKKKNKKADQQKENEELRSLAFSKGPKPKSGGTGPGFSVLSASQHSSVEGPPERQWEEWQRVDREFAADTYEKDLQQALMLSKLEVEETKLNVASGGTDSKGAAGKNKKKKKDKPATMSLGEFQQSQDGEKPRENGTHEESEDPRSKRTTSGSEPDPKFFDKVESDAQKIIRKEEIQEEYRKQYVVENARTQQFQDELEKKDEEISKLKKQNKKLETDLKEVKERNQQLCHILAQGEMKGKTTVLLELNQLKQIRDELTEEVSSLTTELEKERSKVHALKSASEKTKGKHGK